MRVVVVGAGSFSWVVVDILLNPGKHQPPCEVVGLLDDNHGVSGTAVLGVPMLGPLSRLPELGADAVICSIGENGLRQRLIDDWLREGRRVANAIHGSAVLGAGVEVGRGVVICAGVIVNPGAIVEDGVIVSSSSTINHHNRIGKCCHVGPGVTLGGSVRIGSRALLGVGCSVLPGKSVGVDSVVGAGAVVTRDVPDGETVVGVPARPLLPE